METMFEWAQQNADFLEAQFGESWIIYLSLAAGIVLVFATLPFIIPRSDRAKQRSEEHV